MRLRLSLKFALLALSLGALPFALAGKTDAAFSPIALAADATAIAILQNAHRVAGGELWRRPKTLHMLGTAQLYQDGQFATRQSADHYEMWREYPAWNATAHKPSGKVRITARAAEKVLFEVAFDGVNTYSQNGLVAGAAASKEWAEAFGFGIIRFALDKGFTHTRLADDLVDGKLCFVLKIHDPAASPPPSTERDARNQASVLTASMPASDAGMGQTIFWIDQQSFEIRKVGFDTPKGWHERVYSDFFRLANGWLQPGRVRLSYRGALTNDVRWTSAQVNTPIAPERFVIVPAGGK
jgi:hypothetical protein